MAGSSDAYIMSGVEYPQDMGAIQRLYKNIEDEPLIRKIKNLEKELPDDLAKRSAMQWDEDKNSLTAQDRKILERLLSEFKKLLKVRYGGLGYLISTTAEQIIHLYGVDTERDFVFLEKGSAIMLQSKMGKALLPLKDMVVAGGNRRWIGERGLLIADPEETPRNMKMTDEAIQEIIGAIKKMLGTS